jgi:hypothetical protein
MKFAYFNPTIVGVDDVPESIFQKLIDITVRAHERIDLNDAGDQSISVRGGQQIQLLPAHESLGIDIAPLRDYVENLAQRYLDNLSTTTAFDLSRLKPVLVSAWTIKQSQGQYQALHVHDANISGNIYIDSPQFDPLSSVTDGKLELRLPVSRDIPRFVFTDTFMMSPNVKQCIVFPSHLAHTVYPWKGTGHRTVIAWDVRFVNKNSTQNLFEIQ